MGSSLRCPPRRINSEEQPHRRRQPHPDRHRRIRQRHGNGKQVAHRYRQAPRYTHADQSACRRQRRRFHQVLVQNVAPARAQRFADADFVRSLRHHRQHDVHDDDPAHHHEHRNDAHRHGADGGRQPLPQADDGLRSEDAEIVVLLRPQVPVGAHQHAGFILGFHQVLLVERLGHHGNAAAAAVGLEVAFDRNHDEVVLRVAENAAQRLGHPHHFVRVALDGDDLPQRVLALEEFRTHIVAQEYHRPVPPHLLAGDGASGIHLHVIDGRNIIRDPAQLHILHGLAFIGNGGVAPHHHADVAQQRRFGADEFIFVRPDFRVALLHLEEFLRVPRPEPSHAHDAESVRAHVGDLVGDVQVHAVDQRGDGNQRGGGQNDAKQREEAAQLVLAQRIERDARGLPKRGAGPKFPWSGHASVSIGRRSKRPRMNNRVSRLTRETHHCPPLFPEMRRIGPDASGCIRARRL